MYSVIFPSASRLRGNLSIEEVANFIFELAQERSIVPTRTGKETETVSGSLLSQR